MRAAASEFLLLENAIVQKSYVLAQKYFCKDSHHIRKWFLQAGMYHLNGPAH